MLWQKVILFATLAPTLLAQVLYVDNHASTNPLTVCGNLSSPCPTLEAALNNNMTLDSVTVQILSSSLILSQPIMLDNSRATAFHLRGRDPNGTMITCSNTSVDMPGLVFMRLKNVSISNINISGCGALRTYEFTETYVVEPNTSYDLRAVIHLQLINNVSITNLNAIGNQGAGIAIIDPQGGRMTISKSHFTNNHVPQQDSRNYSGGMGVFVREGREGGERDSVQLEISHCNFENNQASFTQLYSFVNAFNRPLSGNGRGGWLDVILWHNTSGYSITVSDSLFRNNTAYVGAGTAIQLNDNSNHNQVTIERCIFEKNGCIEGLETGAGGGVIFGYGFQKSVFQPFENNVLFKDTVFKENCAEVGGGLIFFTSRTNSLQVSISNTFVMDNCTWLENEAHIGAAVDILPNVFNRVEEGFLPTLVFKDCNFINNRLAFQQLELYQSFGSGILFSSLINIDFLGTLLFQDNTGTALVIVNAIVDFTQCDAVFVGNTGLQGGAISLTGVSAMLIGPGRTYNFTNNRATDRGGAIYNYLIDDHDFVASRSCFISYTEYEVLGSEWNVSFYFFNNIAGTYGHSIFSSSLLSCIQLILTEQDLHSDQDLNTSMIFRWPEVFHYDDRNENQIATEGGSFMVTESLPFHIIPGDEHELGITTVDDIGQEIEMIFRASVLNASNDDMRVDDGFSCLSGNTIEIRGGIESSGVLLLETITSRKNSIGMDIILSPCPPGFLLTDNKCTCSIDNYSGIVSCDTTNFQANMKLGYWAGYIDNDTFVTGVCPLSFCAYNGLDYEREVPLPKITTTSDLDEHICGPTRSGILCGGCKPGYSVFYHSPKYNCHKSEYCQWGWLFYILSELVPVTLMFVIILVLNINFTSGTISGFILFSQLLDTVLVNGSGVVKYPKGVSVLSWGYQLIYGIFTMEFFNIEPLSFCLWDGATVLDVLAFRYVTIVYAFLLVLLTLLFLKYHGHIFAGKYIRITTIKNSVVHGLSAFIILCYAQTTKVSIYILISGYIRGQNGEILSSQVLLNGDIGFFSVDHLPYALPAIACLLTISTIPPLLLILYPSVNKILAFCKLSETKTVKGVSRMIPINKLKPFLDSFQGCFKDHLRFFAGIYFLYRWIALLMFALVPTVTGFYMSLGNAYILVLMLHTVFQPYTDRVYNIVDGCLLAILAVIYSIAGYNYLFSQGNIEPYAIQSTYITTTASIQLILIYIPIIGMAVYLIFLLYQRITQKSKKNHPISSFVIVEPPRELVRSVDINDLLDGPDEFPARMLEADFERSQSSTLDTRPSD